IRVVLEATRQQARQAGVADDVMVWLMMTPGCAVFEAIQEPPEELKAADATSCVLTQEARYDGRVQEEEIQSFNAQVVASQARLVRDIFGNPFRRVAKWACRTSEEQRAVRVAETIYSEGRFDELPVLADALEEADCTDVAVLDHCRHAGEHIRGCWVL